uniref:MAGUK p55 subfamily member 6-like n=1 Tax=Phallusia mammillata TaxID=59560 RepID=A0A6F9DLS5_9ASCI|nr:MAGUK p55 subfamily member 6-like [Phallusia mammillata]
MPQENTQASIQAVLENLRKLDDGQNNEVKNDVLFLKLLMDCPVVQSLARAHDTLDNKMVNPEQNNSCEIVTQILHDIHGIKSNAIAELTGILQQAHFSGVLQAHDKIAEQRSINQKYVNQFSSPPIKIPNYKNAVRMVGLSKPRNEPLGMMVAVVNHEVVVTRIIHGALVHKQGLLSVGDIIKEVNGKPVKGKPEVLKEFLNKPTPSFILKVVPSYNKPTDEMIMFVQCNYDYDATADMDIPSRDAGLSFKKRDILQIVDCSDKQWWQARFVDKSGEPKGRARLIPSPQFEERRSIKPSRSEQVIKPVCEMYKFSQNTKFDDEHTPVMYEEVCRMPEFPRKVIVVVSEDKSVASQVKWKMTELFKDVYKIPVTHSSNESLQNDRHYVVCKKEKMMVGIRSNEYLEHAEKDAHIHGLKYGSIRDVMKSKKFCLLNMASQNLKFIMNSEFMPFVVHIETHLPSSENSDTEIQTYAHMYNLTVAFSTVEESSRVIHESVQTEKSNPQWLPLSWVY